MVLWLLALVLAAPIHELSHHHDHSHAHTHASGHGHQDDALEHCDFFVHQQQLASMFWHEVPLLPGNAPLALAPALEIHAWLQGDSHRYHARAPPAHS
ncbi:hypothetical protein [Ferrimonas marina]|uniref:Uncharacterized protein n=1 Tax=Ferrimonas marina TaxID=299255 RepID=A0A1M5XA85_9GAMM|nr:hypothetical protein [Ferrimonas marina]SHH96777.1 hypothetical protein SAMN02745129_3381 [Ferrimonas marina]